jgi:hypothetical protein
MHLLSAFSLVLIEDQMVPTFYAAMRYIITILSLSLCFLAATGKIMPQKTTI